MTTSRRSFLATTLVAAGLPASSLAAEAAIGRPSGWLGRKIVREFNQLPGRKALEMRPLGIRVLRNIFAWIKDAFGTCH
jgi:hypothetical protein